MKNPVLGGLLRFVYLSLYFVNCIAWVFLFSSHLVLSLAFDFRVLFLFLMLSSANFLSCYGRDTHFSFVASARFIYFFF